MTISDNTEGKLRPDFSTDSDEYLRQAQALKGWRGIIHRVTDKPGQFTIAAGYFVLVCLAYLILKSAWPHSLQATIITLIICVVSGITVFALKKTIWAELSEK